MNCNRAPLTVAALTMTTALTLASSSTARAFDIVSQDVLVDMSGDTLHIEIEARIDGGSGGGGGDLPIYAFAAPVVSATVDGNDVSLDDEVGDYAGIVQWLSLPSDITADQIVRIVLDGRPSCVSAVRPGFDACTFRDDERALLPLQPGAAWYLTNLYGGDPFTGSVTVRARDGHHVVSGQAPGEPTANGALRFDVTVPTEYLAVVARDVIDVVSEGRVSAGVPFAEGRAAMERMVAAAASVLPEYERMFGALPVDDVRFVPLSGRFPFGGMGLLGTVLIGDFITFTDFDYLVEQGAAHELAHSWWGGMTSAVDPSEAGFLQEAFAEWSAWRALGAAQQSDAVRDAGVRMNAVWYLTQTNPEADVAILGAGDDPDAYVLVTYHKGSVVLRTLEELVGTDAFEAALAALVARGPLELSVSALEEELEAASGLELGAAIAQWLERPGHARLKVSSDELGVSIDESAGFDVHVPVRIVKTDGSARTVVAVVGGNGGNGHNAGDGSARVEREADDVLVEIDPRWTLVRHVSPSIAGDVTFDGRVDALDMIEVALRNGARIPDARRQDGRYDPLYDLDEDGSIDVADVDTLDVN